MPFSVVTVTATDQANPVVSGARAEASLTVHLDKFKADMFLAATAAESWARSSAFVPESFDYHDDLVKGACCPPCGTKVCQATLSLILALSLSLTSRP